MTPSRDPEIIATTPLLALVLDLPIGMNCLEKGENTGVCCRNIQAVKQLEEKDAQSQKYRVALNTLRLNAKVDSQQK